MTRATRLASILFLAISSCAYSAAVVTARPGDAVDESRAVEVARETARRFSLEYRGSSEGPLPVSLRMPAEFRQDLNPLADYYSLEGSTASIRFLVLLQKDDSLRFAFVDYSHGTETEYVRTIREDLERRLRKAFPDAELGYEQHSGRTIEP